MSFYKRLHFYVGNVYRFLTIPKYQLKIDPKDARSIFGASFGPDGWHHLKITLKEYDADPDLYYKNTTLYKFLKKFRPKSTCDLFPESDTTQCRLPLFVFPWGTFWKKETDIIKNPWTSRFCGPSQDSFIQEEYIRTINLYNKIKEDGYQPWNYGNTFIGGVLLVNKNNEHRFVVLQGNHRMAILSHLGYQNIVVREIENNVSPIFESDIKSWPLVCTGQCPEEFASRIFNYFFNQTGMNILESLK